MTPENWNETRVAQALEACSGAVTGGKVDRQELTLEVAPARIVEVCRFLREKDRFNRLSGITAVDMYPSEPRFEIIYHLHAVHAGGPRNERVRLKCRIGPEYTIDSVTSVWRAADWYEREIFDMFGVTFRNHANLTRILMPTDWEGHPLRKDFPVHGYKYSYPQE